MSEADHVVRQRQFCALSGQLMFEFYRSPDGHFGLVGDVGAELLWACHPRIAK